MSRRLPFLRVPSGDRNASPRISFSSSRTLIAALALPGSFHRHRTRETSALVPAVVNRT